MGEGGGGIRLTFIFTLEISESYDLPIGTICSAATGGDTAIKYSLLDSISSQLLELAILLSYSLWCIPLLPSLICTACMLFSVVFQSF